jgi:two-component system, NarL family, response regulator LiaR
MQLKKMYRYKWIVAYGVSLAALLLLLRWLELRLIIFQHAFEVYAGAIALLFTGLGIWLATKLTRPKTIVLEKEVYVTPSQPFLKNDKAIAGLGLSNRELDVLELMAKGMSNHEIAATLYISVPTVKTHCSRLFEKLDVKRRTQAVETGKRMGLIP